MLDSPSGHKVRVRPREGAEGGPGVREKEYQTERGREREIKERQ